MLKASAHTGKMVTGMIVSLLLDIMAWSQYKLVIIPVDKDSIFLSKTGLQTSFKSRDACVAYINDLPTTLQSKGYPAASIDSVQLDSAFAIIQLFFGESFKLAYVNTAGIDKKLLEQSGWNERIFRNKPLNIQQLMQFQVKMLDYLENNGYPFARLQFDSLVFDNEKLIGTLKIDKGPLYKIDSIRMYGDARISNNFLQRYLEIRNGAIYQKNKLQNISKKLLDLPYIEEKQSWNMTMLGTGSVLNLYLQSKKSSQVNVLVGVLPSNQQTINNKLLVTGEANINLRNAFGNGETLGLNWQQIQIKSPRLNISFQQPFLLGSSFGISTIFDLFKKDSSFLNLNFLLGMQYALSGEQSGTVFIQNSKTNLLSVDTMHIKLVKKLPNEIDISSVNLGVNYEINKTNYRINPKRGSELTIAVSAGTRKIRKNNVITKLYDPAFSYTSLYDSIKQNGYQFRLKLTAAHYFQLGRQATLKTSLSSGWFQSPTIFRNELFQIGGYRLLRGFDEESIFASAYTVGTAEYRYLIGLNSFLFSFIDAGWSANKSNKLYSHNSYIGCGLGMAFETRAGIFNISYAVGKRDDSKFNLRQSKIHIGYINFF